MSQFITIQVGQCGNQIGSEFWPLALEEYGISVGDKSQPISKLHKYVEPDALESFFWVPNSQRMELNCLSDLQAASVKARAICIDMEDSVVNRFRTGHLSNLFDEKCLITNYPGSGNNWAVGHYTHWSQYSEQVSEIVRRTAERCEQLHGFLLLFSLGGGTGSGLGTAVLKMLAEEYSHIDRFVSCIYPGNMNDVITAPYNVALATNELSEHASCVFPIENRALFEICDRVLSGPKSSTPRPFSFKEANSIVVDMVLHLTSAARFPGQMNVDMNEIATNMVPFPKQQYISSSVCPVSIQKKSCIQMRPHELLASVVHPSHQLLKIKPLNGYVCGAAFLVRGDLNVLELRKGIDSFKSRVKFSPWNRNAVKVGLCSVPPKKYSASLLGLLNTTSVKWLFSNVITDFRKLYQRKAHIHHYWKVDQFEECNFTDCYENLLNIVSNYNEIENTKSIKFPRLPVI